jgi:hypothetical protein
MWLQRNNFDASSRKRPQFGAVATVIGINRIDETSKRDVQKDADLEREA